ncbi:hypothetical protein [Enterocloster sp.]|uniref:hypothetical protein n=1 Tax=Enterocloster sp. TaxID=2719315 RepID=UPI00399FA0D8
MGNSKDAGVDAIIGGLYDYPEIWDDTISHMVEAVSIARQDKTLNRCSGFRSSNTRHQESADILKAAARPCFPPDAMAAPRLKDTDFAVRTFEPMDQKGS